MTTPSNDAADSTIPGDPFGATRATKRTDLDIPSAGEVNRIHTKSDVDTGQQAQHHTIGTKRNQAAGARHQHDGNDSQKLGVGKGLTINGKNVPTTVADVDVIIDSIVNILLQFVAATDTRT